VKILIETVPHSTQRYNTVGDWTVSPTGNWHIKVSSLNNWRREVLIAAHELVEMALCRHAGITSAEVDAFDLTCDEPDPGLNPAAPYHKQHMVATAVETLLAGLMEVNWMAYEDQITHLAYGIEKLLPQPRSLD
jgi:hypothetical protein